MNPKILISGLLAWGASFAAPAGAAGFLTALGPFDVFSCAGTGVVTCTDSTQPVSSGANGRLLDAGLFSFDAGAGNVLTSLSILIEGQSAGSFAVGFHGLGATDGLSTVFSYNESTSSYTGKPVSWSFGPTTLFSTGSSEFASFALSGDGQTTSYGLTEKEIQFVADVSPVPEPGEWALMAIGAAMMGAVALRRRAPVAAARGA